MIEGMSSIILMTNSKFISIIFLSSKLLLEIICFDILNISLKYISNNLGSVHSILIKICNIDLMIFSFCKLF